MQHAQEQENIEVEIESTNDTERTPRFTEGDPITFVRVRFPGNSKSFPFMIGKKKYLYGQTVMAMSDRGMTLGYVNSFPYELKFKESMLPIKSINKIADDIDLQSQKEYIDKEKNAEITCKDLIEELKLDMNITHVEIIQFGKKAVFYFIAPARVDFRDLVKSLVTKLKMRIELRQISVRDRTAALGSIGSCGLQTCCSSFLKNYGSVTIKMAKNQNLALIPSKINGVCGQVKCCIKYEDHVYTQKRNILPREGEFLWVENGDKGKVTKLHLFIEQFDMITDQGKIRRYSINQYNPEKKLDKDWKLPTSFNHVVNETKEVIGLTVSEAVQAKQFENDYFSTDEGALATPIAKEAKETEAKKRPQHNNAPEKKEGQNKKRRRRPFNKKKNSSNNNDNNSNKPNPNSKKP